MNKQVCPVCGRLVQVDKDGLILGHFRRFNRKRVPCSGGHHKKKRKKRLWPTRAGLIIVEDK